MYIRTLSARHVLIFIPTILILKCQLYRSFMGVHDSGSECPLAFLVSVDLILSQVALVPYLGVQMSVTVLKEMEAWSQRENAMRWLLWPESLWSCAPSPTLAAVVHLRQGGEWLPCLTLKRWEEKNNKSSKQLLRTQHVWVLHCKFLCSYMESKPLFLPSPVDGWRDVIQHPVLLNKYMAGPQLQPQRSVLELAV